MTLLNWQRSIEHIVVANKGCRVVGLTSVRSGAGVSHIGRGMAKSIAETGARTLVIMLSQMSSAGSDQPAPAGELRASIVPSVHGYDIFSGNDSDGRPIALNARELRQALENELAEYDRIILDLPAICEDAGNGLRAVSVAPICDRVLLVCLVGSDRSTEIAEAAALLRGAGAVVSGVIANEYKRVDPRAILAKFDIFGLSKDERAPSQRQASAG